MSYGSIPIQASPTPTGAAPAGCCGTCASASAAPIGGCALWPAADQDPVLDGPPERLARVLSRLSPVMAEVAGQPLVLGQWLQSLRLDDDAAELTLAPGLPCQAANGVQALFETMRGLLPDTDILVRAARA
jgi:hypothetical protein